MSRPALFSYEGALRVLGRYDRPWLDKADTFLGVSILVGGAIEPGILSLVDPKNEATASLRKILDGITDKLTGLSGTHRHELIAAAHTIIAVTAVFDAFRKELGEDFDQIKITDREKFRILSAAPPEGGKEVTALPFLTSMDVPAPNSTRGFYENLEGPLNQFIGKACLDIRKFLSKLADCPARIDTVGFSAAVLSNTVKIYLHHYIGISSAIPEFQIWALLGEHAATRALIEQSDARITQYLTAVRTESLELFARLMAQISSGQAVPGQKYRRKLRIVAEATLKRPIIGSNIDASSVDAAFPTVEDGFVAPGYRLAVYDDDTVASSGDWWAQNTGVRDDLDTFLAAHLSGPESTSRPLLVLGNPGAGKSLLMDVLAARLPADRYTVVSVQLRKVRAEDDLRDQIETALRPILGKSVDWEELADSCEDSQPVVLLDGFDELIQASGVQQSNYLQQVQEFQRQQAVLDQPVAVLVTSRMLVADRARIPLEVPIVKLEEFDDDRVERWLDTWNSTNLVTPGFRPISLEALDQHLELARQPLLLLMLAIYAADPSQAPLDDPSLSNAELYRRLINLFVVRQVSQKSPEPLAPDIVKALTAKNSWRLGIAAFAMFNRGHQYVTATELNRDLAIFAPDRTTRQHTSFDTPIDDADRTVENFFFIHSPTLNDGAAPDRRTYEFLHATFGEYLIAEITMKLLVQLAATRAVLAANPFDEVATPDDSRLFALISHQAFVKRMPIIEFAHGLFAALDPDEQERVLDTLDSLIQTFHDRALNDPTPAYKPTRATVVSRIANYSANLVSLRVLLQTDLETPLEGPLTQHDADPLKAWRATVHLWKSGLDPEGWSELVEAITLTTDGLSVTAQYISSTAAIQEARLLGDPLTEGLLRAGAPFVSSDVTSNPREQLLLENVALWLANTSGSGRSPYAIPYDIEVLGSLLSDLRDAVPMNQHAKAALAAALARDAWRLPRSIVECGFELLAPRTPEECQTSPVPPFELFSMVCAHPDLISRGTFPLDLLPHIFATYDYAAMSALVLVWATLQSGDSRVDDAFRRFAKLLEEAVAPHAETISDTYLPVEAFVYFSEARTVEPTIAEVLATLTTVVDSAADLVSPHIIVKLVERFQPRVDQPELAYFASTYLEGRTAEGTADELKAVSFLRQLVKAAADVEEAVEDD
ncbi:NACHT domain-containing protein [Lentzea kentuckyensis]|uniref:NACHT domain-containing protein n=1 Tax=Lentzea kentuckyensis TaxID=360086 RepID=UPI000A3681FE|nr:AAA family ATPase [Lentzea kentuckyensis]